MLTKPALALSAVLILAIAAAAPGQYPDPDLETLYRGKVKRDDAALVKFLHGLSRDEADLARRDELVRQLGDPRFAQREDAVKRLAALGPAAVPALKKAAAEGDAEVRKNARRCLDLIGTGPDAKVVLAAVRVALKRQAPGLVEALLHVLPSSPDYEVEEEISFGLDALAMKDDRVHPALIAALGDGNAKRRAIAGCIVGHRGTLKERSAVAKLLTDADPTVRLRAAQGLLAAKQKDGLPTLVGLLADSPLEVAWQAEELLRYVAGPASPPAFVGHGTDNSTREECRRAWVTWWQANAATLDLTRPEKEHRRPGLVLLCDKDPKKEDATLWITGYDGSTRCQFSMTPAIYQSAALPTGTSRLDDSAARGTCMYVTTPGRRFFNRLREGNGLSRTAQVSEYRYYPEGNLLIVGGGRALEFDRLGRVKWAAFFSRDTERGCLCSELLRLGFDWRDDDEFDRADTMEFRWKCLTSQDKAIQAQAMDWLRIRAFQIGSRLFPDYRLIARAVARRGDFHNLAKNTDVPLSLLEAWLASRSPIPEVRAAGVLRAGLFTTESKLMAPDIIAAMSDRDARVRHMAAAIAFVLQQECKRLVPALIAVLDDTDSKVRVSAINSLGNLRTDAKAALPALIKLLEEDPSVSAYAGTAVGDIGRGDPSALRALLQAAERVESRDGSVRGLAKMGIEARPAMPVLIAVLKNADAGTTAVLSTHVRMGAACALGNLGPDASAAISLMCQIVSDEAEDVEVQTDCIAALGRIGRAAEGAIPIIAAARNRDLRLRTAADIALKNLKQDSGGAD